MSKPGGSVIRKGIVVLATLAILGLVLYARGTPGDDGRVGDTEDASFVPVP